MAHLMYYLTAAASALAALVALAGLVRLLTLDMGRWWARQNPPPQQYGEGRTL